MNGNNNKNTRYCHDTTEHPKGTKCPFGKSAVGHDSDESDRLKRAESALPSAVFPVRAREKQAQGRVQAACTTQLGHALPTTGLGNLTRGFKLS
jgi:hypothetical protein